MKRMGTFRKEGCSGLLDHYKRRPPESAVFRAERVSTSDTPFSFSLNNRVSFLLLFLFPSLPTFRKKASDEAKWCRKTVSHGETSVLVSVYC